MLQQEVAPCACGPRYAGVCGGGRCASPAPAPVPALSSLLFPMPMGLPAAEQCHYYYHAEDGGPVDCTLSLSTPSTRRAEAAGVVHSRAGGGGGGGGAAVLTEEPRQGSPPRRRCANCDTASTPLWRNGPRGPKSLCNACGIRHKKEERRAAAAVAPAPATQDSGARPYACGGYARPPPPPQQQQQQWGCYASPAAGKSAASYGMYGGDVDAAAAAVDGSYLSWMLNVVPSSPAFAVRERHTLFQYY